jgi:ribosomal protein S18 acetylase RimI-like enzyme
LVGSDNRRAIRVYTDVGFEVVSEVQGDPRTPGQLLLMRLQLQLPEDAQVIELQK